MSPSLFPTVPVGELCREPVAATFHPENQEAANLVLSAATFGSSLVEFLHYKLPIPNQLRNIATIMAASDDEKGSNASEEHEEKVAKETVVKRPAAAEPDDEEPANPPKRPHRRTRVAIDLNDQSAFMPLSLIHI